MQSQSFKTHNIPNKLVGLVLRTLRLGVTLTIDYLVPN